MLHEFRCLFQSLASSRKTEILKNRNLVQDGTKGVKWELGIVYFVLEKDDSMHCAWDSLVKKNNRKLKKGIKI